MATEYPPILASTLTANAPTVTVTFAPSALELAAVVNAPSVAGDSYAPPDQPLTIEGIDPTIISSQLPSPLTSSITINAPGLDRFPPTLEIAVVLNAPLVLGTLVTPVTQTFELTSKLYGFSIIGDKTTVFPDTVRLTSTFNTPKSGPTVAHPTFELTGTVIHRPGVIGITIDDMFYATDELAQEAYTFPHGDPGKEGRFTNFTKSNHGAYTLVLIAPTRATHIWYHKFQRKIT